jgi:hypothetical protein
MNSRTIAALVLVPFLVFSLWVAWTDGPLGFLTLAGREPWGLQMLLDLVIMSSFAIGYMLHDARTSGRNPWPFVLATIAVGSIAPLVYIATGRRT